METIEVVKVAVKIAVTGYILLIASLGAFSIFTYVFTKFFDRQERNPENSFHVFLIFFLFSAILKITVIL